MPLAIGALFSASSFGSHACFFSDSTVHDADGGSVGATEYEMADGHKVTMLAWHQDQVTVAPKDAE